MWLALPLLFASLAVTAQQRSIELDDLERLKEVSDPEIAPDGQWILYTVSTIAKDADHRESQLWEVSWDGATTIQLTSGHDGVGHARWSPDGKYISFTSSRTGPAKGPQIWVLDRRGGEARQFTALKGRIGNYAWSPDSQRIALIYHEGDGSGRGGARGGRPTPDADPAHADAAHEDLKPIVVDRYAFKRDGQGYIADDDHSRIFFYTVATGKVEPLTDRKDVDEESPVWSPDGSKIAFVSNRDKDPDRTRNAQVYVANSQPGAPIHAVTSAEGVGGRVAWSPDGTLIAYTVGSEAKYNFHSTPRLAVVPSSGGTPRILTASLDRGVSGPSFSEDGKTLKFLVTDDLWNYPASVPVAGGAVEKLLPTPAVINGWSEKAGHAVVIKSDDNHPAEIFAWDGGNTLRPLTKLNDELVAQWKLGPTEEARFKSKDGTEIHGLLVKPADYDPSRKYPALIRIHGGPSGQDVHSFQFERQYFAAHGYIVLTVNYRGSTGRGAKFTEAIFQNWGHKEVDDVLAGADYLVSSGLSDAQHLGIGGWSYGGVLTDYVIASDTRFKAAISGAGSANHISLYGHDQYTYLYDSEFGPPWKDPELWINFSYPFFHADKIHTPTLFLGGLNDSNVPVLGGEQLYQALQTLEVPTELVVYPTQNHGFTRESFIRDRYERYISWYDKYLKGSNANAASGSSQPGASVSGNQADSQN
jgi:dipeptidyl aminopeptidase/acylaminoacyl peptidase